MDRLKNEDGRHPFVLATNQIAEINRRAALCDHPIAKLVAIATLIPCDASDLSRSHVRAFDRRDDVIMVRGPTGVPTRVALGRAAAAAVRDAIGGRNRGLIVEDAYGSGIVPDGDTMEYAHELLSCADTSPLPFGFTFRSLREGVFAGMVDGVVPLDVAEAQAGLRHSNVGHGSETMHRIGQRAASDWWASAMGVPMPATIDVLRQSFDRTSRVGRPNGSDDQREGGS